MRTFDIKWDRSGLPRGRIYNPSIASVDGRVAIVARIDFDGMARPFQPHLVGGWVSDGYTIKEPAIYDIDLTSADPRLFWYGGELWMSYYVKTQFFPTYVIRMCLARLDKNLKVVKRVRPSIGTENAVEKNWGWFEHNGQLCCVYSIAPHHVVYEWGDPRDEEDGATIRPVSMWKTDAPEFLREIGIPRGGAPPVHDGTGILNIYHGVIDPPRSPKRVYHAGAYRFEPGPPFRVTHVPSEPILDDKQPIIFPAGVLWGERRVVSYGVNDHICRIAEFGPGEIGLTLRAAT